MRRNKKDASRRDSKQSASEVCHGAKKSIEYYRISQTGSELVDDEESPSRNSVGYHLVDHEYGVTPKNQIIHGDPVEPPRSTHVSISIQIRNFSLSPVYLNRLFWSVRNLFSFLRSLKLCYCSPSQGWVFQMNVDKLGNFQNMCSIF